MIGIGTIISIAASVFQTVQALNRPDPATQKADQLFSQLDLTGKGSIDGADLQTAFDKIATTATQKADQLFAKLDADGDGKIVKEEFSGSINRLAEQLDQQYMRSRMYGEGAQTSPGPPALPAESAGFSRDEITGLATSIANNFDKADANGDGRVSINEAKTFMSAKPADATTAATAANDQNVDLMLQVVKLMQAYGQTQVSKDNATRISTSA